MSNSDKILNYLMGILSKILRWFGYDGLLHFVVCFVLTDIIGTFISTGIAFTIVLALALWREISDKKRKGHFEWQDFYCDLIGIAIPTILNVYSKFIPTLL